MKNNNDWIVFDGDFVPGDQPIAPATSRGLMYGDGVFETFRSYSGDTLLLKQHVDRLGHGLSRLGMKKPHGFSLALFKLLVTKLLRKKKLIGRDAVIRVQVWREGSRGYHTSSNAQTHFSIIASQCPESFGNPKLATVQQKRIPSVSLPSDVKLTNGINYILAAREADEKEADDALMQTIEGWLSETTIANIFWVKGDSIFTPSKECDLIPGITRDILIQLIENNDHWKLHTGKFELSHLLDSQAVWICNSVREMVPVLEVNGHSFDINHPVITDLKKAFARYRDANLEPLEDK
jgi:branched-subunit amino acid aminotransferase/4-amino-4-deoxychorismate lyase